MRGANEWLYMPFALRGEATEHHGLYGRAGLRAGCEAYGACVLSTSVPIRRKGPQARQAEEEVPCLLAVAADDALEGALWRTVRAGPGLR